MNKMESDKKLNQKIIPVWILFFIYLIIYFIICLGLGNQQFLWLELACFSMIISIYLLIQNKMPKKKSIIISLILALVYLASNIYQFNIFSAFHGILVFLSSCASFIVFEKYKEHSLCFVRNEKKKDIVLSIIIGIICGIVWGGINYFLMIGSNPLESTNVFKAFLVSLNPAVIEEISCRCIFFAFCLYMAGGEIKRGAQSFTVWFMMIVPHILPHILFNTSNGVINSIVSFLISLVLYIVVFGFIFAFLQKKRDIISAMIAHGVVDWIKFCIFGLPF
jgi:hypothetical protein